MKKVKKIEISVEQAEELKQRISANNLSEADRETMINLLEFSSWMQLSLMEAKLSINRLKKLFGFSTEKKDKKLNLEEIANKHEPDGDNSDPGDDKAKKEDVKNPKNSGKYSANDYSGAPTIEVAHEALQPGGLCPLECSGRLYSYKPSVIVKFTGQPIAAATKYQLERLRCSACMALFTANCPKNVSNAKYDYKCRANLALAKYLHGMPFNRIESMQEIIKMPLAKGTQWKLIKLLYDDVLPVYEALEYAAAQAQTIYRDDTPVKILSVIKANSKKLPKDRIGTHTTGIVAKTSAKQTINLYYSSTNHAGKNITKLLQQREEKSGVLVDMADGLAANMPQDAETADKMIICNCLVHGRRKFYEIYESFPEQCGFVINKLSHIYKNDHYCLVNKLTDTERLAHHKQYSSKIMEELHDWLKKQLSEKKAEPNSSFGKAIQYMLKRWNKLTRFLEVPGAPLDTNIVERALKIPIRVRKGALFFKTESGAIVGSRITSIIQTCVANNCNPLEYLECIQRNCELVASEPHKWLPWNYHSALAA